MLELATPLPERLMARYRLVEELGGDRLAEAHLAKSLGVEGFEKTMVARVLAEPWRSSAVVIERVHAEATRALRLSHANVVQIFDLLRGEDEAGPYLVWMTEHVRGVSLLELVDRLKRSGRVLDLGLVLFLGGEIAKALDHAHRRRNDLGEKLGAVHGALEPRCVIVSFEGTVKVANFGIARPLVEIAAERQIEDIALPWASPACRLGERATPVDDIYAFGALLRALATTSSSAEAPPQLLWEELPQGLRAFLTSCIADDPASRPTSAAALHEELDALAYELGTGDGASELSALLTSVFASEASVPLPTWAAQAASSSLLRVAPRASLFTRRDLHTAFKGALRAASQREPQVLVVRGAPGSGVSTALRQELDRIENPGRAVLVRTPDDFAPAGAIVVMLRALLGFTSEGVQAPEPLDTALRALGLTDEEREAVLTRTGVLRASGPVDRSRPLRSAFASIVRRMAEDGLLVLAWDDVASMDDESMEILIDGVRDVFVGSPVVLALAGLPEDGDSFARENVTEVNLTPIERAAAGDYLRRVTGLTLDEAIVDALWQRTGGHAGLMAYGARAIVNDVSRAVLVVKELPTDWHEAARQVVNGLPAELRGWAEELAFAGEDAVGKLVTRDGRCESLLQRGVLVLDDGTTRMRFASETVAAELRAAVPSDRRRAIHKALADRGAQSESLLARGALARFLLEAGEYGEAGQAFLASAETLEERGEVRGALRELERGLELASSPLAGKSWLEHFRQYERLARRVRASSLGGDRIEALEAEFSKRDPERSAEARTLLGRALSAANRFVEASEFFARAREGLAIDDPARVRLDVAEAEAELRRGDFHGANKCFARVEPVEEQLGEVNEGHATLCMMAVGRAGEGDDEGATSLLERAERLVPASSREAWAERARTRSFVAFLGRHYDLAYATIAAQLEGIRSDGPSFELAAALHNAGHALVKLGDRSHAHGLLRHSLALAEDVGFDRLASVNRGILGYLDALSGDKRGEGALRESIRRASASGFVLDALDGRALLAALMVDRGDRSGAWRELEQVLQQAQALRYARLRVEARELLDGLRSKAAPASSKRTPSA